jgi:hypothetical protein
VVSDLPTYPDDAAEREAVIPADGADRAYATWLSRVGAYLLDVLILVLPLIGFYAIIFAIDPGDTGAAWGALSLAYLASLVLPFIYFTVLHGNERGQTYSVPRGSVSSTSGPARRSDTAARSVATPSSSSSGSFCFRWSLTTFGRSGTTETRRGTTRSSAAWS